MDTTYFPVTTFRWATQPTIFPVFGICKPDNGQKEEQGDVSPYYILFQALRFVFLDEFSTAAIEIFAEIP